MIATLTQLLAARAVGRPDALFVRCLGADGTATELTYAAAQAWAGRWAALLAARGVGEGDPVVLALPNGVDFVGAFFGALLAGGVPAALPPLRSLAVEERSLQTIADRLRFLDSRVLVVPPAHAVAAATPLLAHLRGLAVVSRDQLPQCPPPAEPRGDAGALALLQLTSGTAGATKAVELTHRAVLAQLEGLAAALALDPERDSAVSWLPLFHDMGLIGFLLTPAFVGRHCTLLEPADFAARPGAWPRALSDYRATITGGPPSAYALCARRARGAEGGRLDLGHLRVALVGAEMVTAESLDGFVAAFAGSGLRPSCLTPTYGLAENGLAVTMPPLGRGPRLDRVDLDRLAEEGLAAPALPSSRRTRAFAAVGGPLPGVEVTVVGEGGQPLPERQVGEILVRGRTLMTGYRGMPATSAEALADGWLHTGDLGYLAAGELHVTGRRKELLIVGGRNYYPDELEQVAAVVPGVRAGRVVAIAVEEEERATERVVVLAETGLGEADERDRLRQGIRQALVRAGLPADQVVLLSPHTLRVTASGKLMRAECRARFLSGELVG